MSLKSAWMSLPAVFLPLSLALDPAGLPLVSLSVSERLSFGVNISELTFGPILFLLSPGDSLEGEGCILSSLPLPLPKRASLRA